MAQVFTIPEIKGLEGLLDLVTHPKQFAEYLSKLQQMLDAINERLGDLDNSKKADEYLAKAQESARMATVALSKANERSAEMSAEAEKIVARANELMSEASSKLAEIKAERLVFENAKSAKMSSDSALREAFEKREADIFERESNVSRREQLVSAEEKRLQGVLADLRAKISV